MDQRIEGKAGCIIMIPESTWMTTLGGGLRTRPIGAGHVEDQKWSNGRIGSSTPRSISDVKIRNMGRLFDCGVVECPSERPEAAQSSASRFN
jgi:hypothetical protein